MIKKYYTTCIGPGKVQNHEMIHTGFRVEVFPRMRFGRIQSGRNGESVMFDFSF